MVKQGGEPRIEILPAQGSLPSQALQAARKVSEREQVSQAKVTGVETSELFQKHFVGLVAVGAEIKQDPDFFDAKVEAAKLWSDEEGLVIDPVELTDMGGGQGLDLVQALVLFSEQRLVHSDQHLAGFVVTSLGQSRVAGTGECGHTKQVQYLEGQTTRQHFGFFYTGK